MGAELIEVYMASDKIMYTFAVFEYFRLGLSLCAVDLLLVFFAFEIDEERFRHRFVPAIPTDSCLETTGCL